MNHMTGQDIGVSQDILRDITKYYGTVSDFGTKRRLRRVKGWILMHLFRRLVQYRIFIQI